jgi:hypothetical protein
MSHHILEVKLQIEHLQLQIHSIIKGVIKDQEVEFLELDHRIDREQGLLLKILLLQQGKMFTDHQAWVDHKNLEAQDQLVDLQVQLWSTKID